MSIENIRHEAAMLEHLRADELRRPFYLLRPRIFMDGNKWCVLYGENLQDGVAGFGNSPHLASLAFDREWFATAPYHIGKDH